MGRRLTDWVFLCCLCGDGKERKEGKREEKVNKKILNKRALFFL